MSDTSSPVPQEGQAIPLSTTPQPEAQSAGGAVLPDILSRLQALEAKFDTTGSAIPKEFVDDFRDLEKKVEAIGETIEQLAKSGMNEVESSLRAEFDSLVKIVASVGGALFGHKGNDQGALFHSWWQKLTGHPTPGAKTP